MPTNPPDIGSDKPKTPPTWQAFELAWELGYTIAVPLVLFALAGRYADKAYHTSPWLLLTGMGLAIVLTTILLIRKFSHLLRDVNKPKA